MAGTAIRRDRTTLTTGAVLVGVALAAWAELLAQPGMSTPEMLDVGEAVAFLAAWGIMMVAMMLPSAVPMVALYGAVRRHASKAGQQSLPEVVFTLVYVLVWVLMGVPVYVGSVLLASQPQLEHTLPYALAVVLILAGVYQLTPLKRAAASLPPVASACRPKEVLRRTTWPIARATTVHSTRIGSGPIWPDPNGLL